MRSNKHIINVIIGDTTPATGDCGQRLRNSDSIDRQVTNEIDNEDQVEKLLPPVAQEHLRHHAHLHPLADVEALLVPRGNIPVTTRNQKI